MDESKKALLALRWLSIIIDASQPNENGESVVPTEDIEDAREAVFGVRCDE